MFYQDFRGDGRTGPVEELTATPNEYIGASMKQTFELNPATQMYRLSELSSLRAGEQQSYTSEMGEQVPVAGSGELAADDPRARRMTLDEANEEGKAEGLRFSDAPTRAQFDYLKELKQAENQRSQTLSKSPGLGTAALGLVGDFAASAVDPINVVSAFVPVVSQARSAALVARLGTGGGRAAKGVIEGAVGTAMVEPLIYGQAQALQQNFTLGDAFADVVFGGVLGGGLHWGAGYIGDRYKAYRKAFEEKEVKVKVKTDARLDAYNAWRWANGIDAAPDMRTIKVAPGENPHIVEAMKPEDRAQVLNATVKAVENDRFPRVDELLKTTPSARALALPADAKRPATLRLGGGFRASDFRPDSAVDDIISQHLHATVKGASDADPVQAHAALMHSAMKSSKAFKDWAIDTVSPEEFNAKAPKDQLEFPEQQVYVDPETKVVRASTEATLGAVHHEIQRALDIAQGYRGEMAGGYRYHRSDADGPLAHRRALEAANQSDPSRAPAPSASPEQAIDLFGRAEPIHKPDEAASQAVWERVQDGKDKDLDTLVAEEELEVLEDTARHLQNSARAQGVFERVIPIEEREVLDVAAVTAPAEQLRNKLDAEIQEAVDQDHSDAAVLNQVRAIMDQDPELLKKWLDDEITDDELDAIMESRPLPEKTPEEGAEIDAEAAAAKEAEMAEDELIADMAKQVEDMLKSMTPQDATDIEAGVMAREQQLLSGNRQVKDLFRVEELEEANAANSERASRQGQGADEESGGAGVREQPAGTSLEDGLFATATGGDGPTDGGARAVLNTERSAPGSERSPVETAQSLALGAIPKRVITPDGTIEVGVEPIIVEYASLRKAEGKFQPRDRTRKESDANIMARASNLDPEQLVPTRVSDSGPPIITPDGMVISGNGRYMTIGTVYRYGDTMQAQALRYRERLGPAADGFKQPILVMRITDAMTDEELVKFADKSNRGRIEQMSATEKAQRDVQAAGMDLMQLYKGGDFESRDNRQFLQGFMRRVVTTQELGEVSKNGRLTKEGYDRLNAAVLAAAYDDTGVLSLMLESADDNIRSITSAYRDVAPKFMQLRAEIAAGVVKPDLDITPYMMQAARHISEQREKGVKVSAFLAQQDAFDPLDPVIEGLIRAYYNPELTRAVSALRIGEFLTSFVDEARLHQQGGFIPDETSTRDVMEVAKRRVQGEPSNDQDPTGLLGNAGGAGPSAPEVRSEAPQPAPVQARREAGAGGERGQLPGSNASVTLEFQGNPTSGFQTIVAKSGERRVATMTVRSNGETLRIANVETDNGPNALGPTVMRAIRAELAKAYPNATHMTGNRITGARGAIGKKEEVRIALQPRKVDLEPALPVRAEQPAGVLDARAVKLRELKERPADFAAYVKTLGSALKKDTLVKVAEDYLGKPLPAKDKRSKQAILDTIGRGEVSDTGRAVKAAAEVKLDANLPVPLQSLAGLSVMQLRKVAKDANVTLGAKVTKKGDIIAMMHTIFNADGTRKVGDEPATPVAPKAADEGQQESLLIPGASKDYENQLRQAGWSEARDYMDNLIGLTDNKLHLLRDPAEKEIAREVTFLIEDARTLLERNRFDEARAKITDALNAGMPFRSSASQLWMQDVRMIARKQGIAVPEGATPQVQRAELFETPAPEAAPAPQARPTAAEPVSMVSMFNRQGEEAVRARMAAMDDENLDAVLKRQRLDFPGQATKEGKIELAIAEIKSLISGRISAAGGSSEHPLLDIRRAQEAAQAPAEPPATWPESMSARPTRRSAPVVEQKAGPKLPLRSFYDYLEGPLVVKSARWMAKQLGVSLEVAHKLLDHGVDSGWLKLKDDGTYIRVAKKDRPVRPGTKPEGGDFAYGWGATELDEPKTPADWIAHIQSLAILHLAARDKTSPRFIQEMFGYTNRHDYVRVAQQHAGFEVPEIYMRAYMERELQVQLIGAKVLNEAARILPEQIKVHVNMDLSQFGRNVQGRSWRNIIEVAKLWDENKALDVIHHETVHSLRRLRMFTAFEWKLVEREALGNESWMPSARKEVYMNAYAKEAQQWLDYDGRVITESQKAERILEEAFAWAYGKWAASRKKPETAVERLFERIQTFFDRLMFNAKKFFRAATAEDVMKAIYRGDIGARWSDWNGGRVDDNSRNALRTFALDEQVKDMNDRMREMAFDDSEKIGNVAARSIEALMPCVAYHL